MVLCSIEECELDSPLSVELSTNLRKMTRYIEHDLLQQGVYSLGRGSGLIAIISFP